MDKPVVISIQATQSSEEQENENIELVTEGLLRRQGRGYLLSYAESTLTGLEGTVTSFEIEPRRITLKREGSVNSQMIFEEGKRHLSLYETAYGALSVGVLTQKASSTVGEHGGDIEIIYALEIDHAVSGRSFFRINVKEPGGTLSQ